MPFSRRFIFSMAVPLDVEEVKEKEDLSGKTEEEDQSETDDELSDVIAWQDEQIQKHIFSSVPGVFYIISMFFMFCRDIWCTVIYSDGEDDREEVCSAHICVCN